MDEIYDESIYAAVNRCYRGDPKVFDRSKYALAAAIKVKQIIRSGEAGDVLVFLPGQVAWTLRLFVSFPSGG